MVYTKRLQWCVDSFNWFKTNGYSGCWFHLE